MKKILPIIAITGIVGTGLVFSGCEANLNAKQDIIQNNVNQFRESFDLYSDINNDNYMKTSFNKYKLTITPPKDLEPITSENIETTDKITENEQTPNFKEVTENIDEYKPSTLELNYDNEVIDTETNNDITNETIEDNQEETFSDKQADTTNTNNEQISTLYSLSNDIEDQCEDFCELKEDITEAIIETENLLNKIKNNEIALSDEQKMLITEQSTQLKNLGRKLSSVTTELSLNLSSLNQLMTSRNLNFDDISLKYLIVLDNLINGNEMLFNGLNSLNLINQMINSQNPLPPNNRGRIMYGFQNNNENPIIKDYYIDENGQVVENKGDITTENQENQNSENTEKTGNIDTYQTTNLNTNIDSYGNYNRNIDTFFNTALLDNQFMYGNGGFGANYGGFNGYGNGYGYGAYNNPYMAQYGNYTEYNQMQNQLNQKHQNENHKTKDIKRKNFKFNLKKNVDTYRDENTPSIKSKLNSMKNAVTNFLNKISPNDADDRIQNPIYRIDEENEKLKKG